MPQEKPDNSDSLFVVVFVFVVCLFVCFPFPLFDVVYKVRAPRKALALFSVCSNLKRYKILPAFSWKIPSFVIIPLFDVVHKVRAQEKPDNSDSL